MKKHPVLSGFVPVPEPSRQAKPDPLFIRADAAIVQARRLQQEFRTQHARARLQIARMTAVCDDLRGARLAEPLTTTSSAEPSCYGRFEFEQPAAREDPGLKRAWERVRVTLQTPLCFVDRMERPVGPASPIAA